MEPTSKRQLRQHQNLRPQLLDPTTATITTNRLNTIPVPSIPPRSSLQQLLRAADVPLHVAQLRGELERGDPHASALLLFLLLVV